MLRSLLPLLLLGCAPIPHDLPALGYRALPVDAAAWDLPVERGPVPEVLHVDAPAEVFEGAVAPLTASAEPGDPIAFVYSTAGPGVSCPDVLMGACLDIRRPRLLGWADTDADGEARLPVPVRCGVAPLTVWVQAVYLGEFEAVISEEVAVIDLLPSDDCGLRADRMMFDLYVGVEDDTLQPAVLGPDTYAPSLNIRLGNADWAADIAAGVDDPSNYCSMYWRLEGSPRTDWADDMWIGWDLALSAPVTDCALYPGTLRDDPYGFIESGDWRLAFGEVSAETADWLPLFTTPEERDRLIGAKVDTGALYGEHWDYTYTTVYPVDADMVVEPALEPFLADDVRTPSGVVDGWYLTYSGVVLALP